MQDNDLAKLEFVLKDVSLEGLQFLIEQLEAEYSYSRKSKQSLGQEKRSNQEAPKSCEICGRQNNVWKQREGYLGCKSCYVFLQVAQKRSDFPFACKTGRNNCKLRPKPGICRGCRVRRAIDLGVKFPKLKSKRSKSAGSHRTFPEKTRPPVSSRTEAGGSKSVCEICSNADWVSATSYGFRQCRNCYNFLGRSRRAKYKVECSTRRYDCKLKQLTPEQLTKGQFMCPGCRLKRAIDLGYRDTGIKRWMSENSLSVGKPKACEMPTVGSVHQMPIIPQGPPEDQKSPSSEYRSAENSFEELELPRSAPHDNLDGPAAKLERQDIDDNQLLVID